MEMRRPRRVGLKRGFSSGPIPPGAGGAPTILRLLFPELLAQEEEGGAGENPNGDNNWGGGSKGKSDSSKKKEFEVPEFQREELQEQLVLLVGLVRPPVILPAVKPAPFNPFQLRWRLAAPELAIFGPQGNIRSGLCAGSPCPTSSPPS